MTLTIDAEVDDAMKQLIADLEAARDIIAVYGLSKQIFGEAGTPCCTVGALMQAVGDESWNDPRVERAIHALAVTLGTPSETVEARRGALFDFNDDPFVTEDDVIALYNLAIDRLTS